MKLTIEVPETPEIIDLVLRSMGEELSPIPMGVDFEIDNYTLTGPIEKAAAGISNWALEKIKARLIAEAYRDTVGNYRNSLTPSGRPDLEGLEIAVQSEAQARISAAIELLCQPGNRIKIILSE